MINMKEVLVALTDVKIFLDNVVRRGQNIKLEGDNLCSIGHYAEYHRDVIKNILERSDSRTECTCHEETAVDPSDYPTVWCPTHG